MYPSMWLRSIPQNGMKNTHAKNAYWPDAEKYPEIKFTSSSVTSNSDGFEAKGILDMHGVQKEITLPFTFLPFSCKKLIKISGKPFLIRFQSRQKAESFHSLMDCHS